MGYRVLTTGLALRALPHHGLTPHHRSSPLYFSNQFPMPHPTFTANPWLTPKYLHSPSAAARRTSTRSPLPCCDGRPRGSVQARPRWPGPAAAAAADWSPPRGWFPLLLPRLPRMLLGRRLCFTMPGPCRGFTGSRPPDGAKRLADATTGRLAPTGPRRSASLSRVWLRAIECVCCSCRRLKTRLILTPSCVRAARGRHRP